MRGITQRPLVHGVEPRITCGRDWRPKRAIQRLEEESRVRAARSSSRVEVDIKLARTDLWRSVAEDYSRRQDFFTVLANEE